MENSITVGDIKEHKFCREHQKVECPLRNRNKSCDKCIDITKAGNFILNIIKPKSGSLKTGSMNNDFAAYLAHLYAESLSPPPVSDEEIEKLKSELDLAKSHVLAKDRELQAIRNSEKPLLEFIEEQKKQIDRLSLSPAQSDWVSVKDRLPELAGKHLSRAVLVYNTYHNFVVSFYDYELKRWTGFNYGMVTHWMELPNNPKI